MALKSKYIPYLLILPVVIALVIYYYQIYQKVTIMYGDEHALIANSYYFELLATGDLNNPLWKSWLAFDQPKLVVYYNGSILYKDYLKHKKDNETINSNYDMVNYLIDHSFYPLNPNNKIYKNYLESSPRYIDWSTSSDNNPYRTTKKFLLTQYGPVFNETLDLIFKIRRVNILILAASLILVYAIIVSATKSITIALLSTLLYGLNYNLVSYSLRTQSEGLFLLFFNLCLLQLFVILTSKNTPKLLHYILLGVSIGLLNQTKINGVMILLVFNFIVIAKYLFRIIKINIGEVRPSIHQIITVNMVAFVVFVALNPYLYSNPIQNTLFMYKWRDYVSNRQLTIFTKDQLLNPVKRVHKIYNNLLIRGTYRDSSNYNDHIQLFPFRSYGTDFQKTWLILLNIFFFSSVVYLTSTIVFKRYLHQNKTLNITQITKNITNILWLIVISILIQLVTSMYLKLDWERYYVHLVLFFAFMESMGVYIIFELIFRIIKRFLQRNNTNINV